MDTLQDVRNKLEYEGGFEYFINGSNFLKVKDEEFHRLRKNFIAAYNELNNYLLESEFC